MNPYIGRRYIVIKPDEIVFYKEASYKSESFIIEEPEKLRVEAVECVDQINYFSCIGQSIRSPDIIFYKVLFESGKVGYVSQRYFNSDYFVDTNSEKYLSNFLFRADYEKVWNAALDTLDESGYVIMQADKVAGYISTGRKEGIYSRNKVSLRLTRESGGVMVRVNVYYEKLITTGTEPYWRERAGGGGRASMIRDDMESKLGVDAWHPIKYPIE